MALSRVQWPSLADRRISGQWPVSAVNWNVVGENNPIMAAQFE